MTDGGIITREEYIEKLRTMYKEKVLDKKALRLCASPNQQSSHMYITKGELKIIVK